MKKKKVDGVNKEQIKLNSVDIQFHDRSIAFIFFDNK